MLDQCGAQLDLAAVGGEFHGVAEDVDHDLAELDVVANVVFGDLVADIAQIADGL